MKNTKGNLIKKIPLDYKNLIRIGNYSSKYKGYVFALKLAF